MGNDDSPKIEFVEGQAITPRRAVAWLLGRDDLDAKRVFDNLDDNNERFVRNSMSAWTDGSPDIPGRFHGFPGDETFPDGFLFKFRENRVNNRFYGFKMRPGIPNDRFDICVLTTHATKTDETPQWVKNAVSGYRNDAEIRKAVTEQVKEYFAKREKGWTKK